MHRWGRQHAHAHALHRRRRPAITCFLVTAAVVVVGVLCLSLLQVWAAWRPAPLDQHVDDARSEQAQAGRTRVAKRGHVRDRHTVQVPREADAHAEGAAPAAATASFASAEAVPGARVPRAPLSAADEPLVTAPVAFQRMSPVPRGRPRTMDRRGRKTYAPGQDPRKRLLVVSAGGVGTTYIMTTLERALEDLYVLNDESDHDKLKHMKPTPAYLTMLINSTCYRTVRGRVEARACAKRFGGRPHKIIYIMNDPFLATASIYRRKLGRYMYETFHPGTQIANNDTRLWLSKNNYTEYVAAVARTGQELLGISDHFYAWRELQPPVAPTLFIMSPTLFSAPRAIERFLEVEPGTLSFNRTARLSRYSNEPAAYRNAFADLARDMASMDGVLLPDHQRIV